MNKAWLLLVPIVVGVATFLILRSIFLAPANPNATEPVYVVIEPGMTLGNIAQRLEESGVIKSAFGFRLLARLRKEDKRISAGEYSFLPSLPPKEILTRLIEGQTIKRIVTVVPGMVLDQIAKAISDSGVIDYNEMLNALFSEASSFGLNSLEGYLFPETYHFSKPITPKAIIEAMIKQGERLWSQEFSETAATLGYTRHQIMTLASIIEKETPLRDEMPLVSSVYHNRLKKGMRLQADPTVVYGIKDFDGVIRRSDLDNPHPYNTYVHAGLPPGPIGAPGIEAIRAALYPATSNYLFFVADGKGGHKFSATYREHRNNVSDYRKSLQDAAAP